MSANSSIRFPRIAFAGDRDIAVWVLDFLLERDVRPVALLLPDEARASHASALHARCHHLRSEHVFHGKAFRSDANVRRLQDLRPDYLLCIHFPHIIPQAVLDISACGAVNLHPAFLPYNRGWHTPSWAILDQTPYGATLHFMEEELDAGPVLHQRRLPIRPDDTAHTLYQRALQLERDVFAAAWPRLAAGCPPGQPQKQGGTTHRRDDLSTPAVQELSMEETLPVKDVIDRLRALTTNQVDEAAYFVADGVRYRVQVHITPETDASLQQQDD